MNLDELTEAEKKLIELLRTHPQLAGRVEEVVAVVRAGGEAPGTIGAAEERLGEPLRALGLDVLAGWAQRAEARAVVQAQAADPGLRPRGKKKTTWHCAYGTLVLTERVWRSARSSWQRPFRAAAGLSARGCSPRLQRLACDFALETPFVRAAGRLAEHHGVTLAPSTLRRLTLRHAGALRDRALARPPVRTLPREGAATLVAQIDGTILPQVEFAPGPGDRRRHRRVVWRETRLAAVQAAGETQTRYAVSCGELEETAAQWEQAAVQAGWAVGSTIHAVGDGAEWIARLAGRCFGAQGRFLVDLYHVSEYLAAAAPPGDPGTLPRQKADLCAGRLQAVLDELAARLEPPLTDDTHAPVRAAHRYLSNRLDQLDYPAALARGLPLGSGLIESGHRHVLHHRLKLPGAAWLRPHGEAIAHARVVRANGGWPAYWSDLAQARN